MKQVKMVFLAACGNYGGGICGMRERTGNPWSEYGKYRI